MEMKINNQYSCLQQNDYWNGFSHENSATKEELVLTRMEDATNENFPSFFLRRCPIGTSEDEWRQVVEEIRNKFDGEMGKILVDFNEIGYFFIHKVKSSSSSKQIASKTWKTVYDLINRWRHMISRGAKD